MRLPATAALAALLAIAPGAGPCFAQDAGSASFARVKADSLAVYSQMDTGSAIAQTLKKGQELRLNFEIASSTGDWCSVGLAREGATLGFVECSGLDITRPKPPAEAPLPGSPSPVVAGASGPGAGSSGRRAARVQLAPPLARFLASYGQVEAVVVPQGELDDLALERLDDAARGGAPAAMDRAALGHLAAGAFQFSHNDTGDAAEQLRSAVALSAKNPQILAVSLIYLAYVHLLRGEYSEALEPLERARAIAPGSPAVARMSGWAYYGLDRVDEAVGQWKRAQQIEPDPQVALVLAEAERDQSTERDFHQEENRHFIVRYEGGEAPALASRILNTLESDFATLQSTLQYTPASPIGVVLYTNRTFREATDAPHWADAINDGRIRVPVEGLETVDGRLSRILIHELTHSFVRQMTEGRCPVWLNEGLAQYMEGLRSGGNARALVAVYEEKKSVPLSRLEGPWSSFPAPVAIYAYAWSLAAVESLVTHSGMWGIERLFTRLGEESSVEAAMEASVQLSYADLESQTVDYLQQTYRR